MGRFQRTLCESPPADHNNQIHPIQSISTITATTINREGDTLDNNNFFLHGWSQFLEQTEYPHGQQEGIDK